MIRKFTLLSAAALLFIFTAHAQVKIGDNPTTINANSVLELESTTQGFVLPRVSLTNVTSASPLSAGLLTGTMVYSIASPAGGSGVGLYYWDGSKWNFVANASSSALTASNGVSISGNVVQLGSNPLIQNTTLTQGGFNFIQNLNSTGDFAVQEGVTPINSLYILGNHGAATDGFTGINTNTPKNNLDVKGAEAIGTYAGTNTAPSNGLIVSGSVGIGTNSPNASALMQLVSVSQGMSFPSMTTAQRNSIAGGSPSLPGLTIYNTTTGCLEFYVGGNWQPIGCGCTTAPAAPSSIAVSPSGTICPSTSVSYSVSDVSTATSYLWSYTGSIGTGGTSSGSTTTQYNVTYGTNPTAGTLSVKAINACGTSAATTTAVALTPVPSTPGTITQSPSGTVCPGTVGITFTIAAVPNATSYNWTVPAGSVITTGGNTTNTYSANTTTITVTWGSTAGNVTVAAVGCNGTSATSTLAVSFPAAPATPGTITPSPTTFCSGTTVTYSIAAVTNATTYTWTYPTDATYVSGQGTTTLTIVVGSSTTQSVTVTAGDCGGNSSASSIAVNAGRKTEK